MKLNRKTFLHLLELDIKMVEKEMEDSLEREHIISVLKDSVNYYYPNEPIPQELQTYILFKPDTNQAFVMGEIVKPVGMVDKFIKMGRCELDPKDKTIYIVWNTELDSYGCMLALKIEK